MNANTKRNTMMLASATLLGIGTAINLLAVLGVVWKEPELQRSDDAKSLISWALTFLTAASITVIVNILREVVSKNMIVVRLYSLLKRVAWVPSFRQRTLFANILMCMSLIETLRLGAMHIDVKQPVCLPILSFTALVFLYNYNAAVSADADAEQKSSNNQDSEH